jgi:putative ABC transport system substrate-binding protein
MLLFILYAPLLWAEAPAAEEYEGRPVHVSLIISKNIRPYVDAADAIREELDDGLAADIEEHALYNYKGNALNALAERLSRRENRSLMIAVGPEAAEFLWKSVDPGIGHRIYSIVLNPGRIDAPVDPACGVSLNIPAGLQVRCIRESLPDAGKIGIFYDPVYNAEYYEAASRSARDLGITLIPLKVSSKSEIPGILARETANVDGIWLIPDPTVISESISLYIIKQCVLQGVPVIGYNQFFYHSGAAVAFVFNYKALGRQTAEMAAEILESGRCRAQIPDFKVWINRKVYEKLGISVPQLQPPLVLGQ